MNRSMRWFLVVGALLCWSQIAFCASYKIRSVAQRANPVAINNLGQIALNLTHPSTLRTQAVLHSWGAIQTIPFLPYGIWNEAFGLNDRGDVVGKSATFSNPRAFVYSRGVTSEVPLYSIVSKATDINNAGQITGEMYDWESNNFRAFLYDRRGFTIIPSLGPGANHADSINESGDVCGFSSLGGVLGPHAFIYASSGVLSDLGVLAGNGSRARDLNDRRDVVGWSHVTFPTAVARGFFYRDGVMYDAGSHSLRPFPQSELVAVNSKGVAVGWSQAPSGSGPNRPVIYADSVLRDLNSLLEPGSGWILNSASDINDAGEVVGVGTLNGVVTAYALRPVRSPADVANYLRDIVIRMPLGPGFSTELASRLKAIQKQIETGAPGSCNSVGALTQSIAGATGKRISPENAAFLLDMLSDVETGLYCRR